MPKPKALATRVAVVTGAGSGIGKAIATGSPPKAAASSSPISISTGAQSVADELGGPDVAVAVQGRRV